MKELKTYSLLILSILTVLMLFFVITKSRIESIENSRQTLNLGKENLTILTEKVAILNSLDETDLADSVNRLNFALPSEKTIDSLMFTLERLSKEASVSVESLNLSPGKVSTGSAAKANEVGDSINITMEVSGRILDIRSFFELVEGSHLAIAIAKPDLHITKSMEQKTNLTLTIKAYFKPVSLTLGEVNRPISRLLKKEEVYLTELKMLILPEKESLPVFSPRKTNPFTND